MFCFCIADNRIRALRDRNRRPFERAAIKKEARDSPCPNTDTNWSMIPLRTPANSCSTVCPILASSIPSILCPDKVESAKADGRSQELPMNLIRPDRNIAVDQQDRPHGVCNLPTRLVTAYALNVFRPIFRRSVFHGSSRSNFRFAVEIQTMRLEFGGPCGVQRQHMSQNRWRRAAQSLR